MERDCRTSILILAGDVIECSLSLLELFELIEELLDVKLKYTKTSPRISDQKAFAADISSKQRRL